ncbi:XRE family transcriptional regulator [uncultured Roseobacter sp.]|uniref:XRE family transcriptional regulator n=1 Tax=uncultured Roseobacter sp. TaxID=114847 RepID=UPI00261CAFA2|nr:XRE family transcriptional regulator [uncultured Roseobacter sp.]
MFPKTGNTFQNGGTKENGQIEYRDAVWRALTSELGGTHQATKTAMRWTGVSERTARNWISGTHAPAGEHLVELMRNSDAVFLAVLSLAGRSEAHVFASLDVVRTELETMLKAIGTLQEQGHPVRTRN